MASKIKVVKIGQYTVFPRGVVRFFADERKWQERNTALLRGQCKPLDSKTHINQLFTILSIVSHKQLVKEIDLKLFGSEESLLDFGIATIVASVQEGGKISDSQMELKTVSSRVNELSGRLVSSL